MRWIEIDGKDDKNKLTMDQEIKLAMSNPSKQDDKPAFKGNKKAKKVNNVESDLQDLTYERLSDTESPEEEINEVQIMRSKFQKRENFRPNKTIDKKTVNQAPVKGPAKAQNVNNQYPDITCMKCSRPGHFSPFCNETMLEGQRNLYNKVQERKKVHKIIPWTPAE